MFSMQIVCGIAQVQWGFMQSIVYTTTTAATLPDSSQIQAIPHMWSTQMNLICLQENDWDFLKAWYKIWLIWRSERHLQKL